MTLLLILLLALPLLFVGGGLLGWVLKGVMAAINFLWDGCLSSMGCVSWVVIGFLVMLALAL